MNALHVLFKVGEASYVVAAADVQQMESYNGATKVPGTPDYVAGLVQIRGKVIPVVDLRARFGLPPIEQTLDSRVIVVQANHRAVGLLVDCAREVVRLEQSEISAPPEMVMDQAAGFVKSVAQTGKRLVMLIDFEKVIGEEQIHGE